MAIPYQLLRVTSTTGPPSPEAVSALRTKVAKALNISADRAEEHHESAPWRFNLLQKVLTSAADPDIHCARWLEHGAPVGVSQSIPLGGHFPTLGGDTVIDVDTLDKLEPWSKKHPSFGELHGESRPPGLALVEQNINADLGRIFRNRADAERWLGKKAHPAPLGNVAKVRDDGTVKHLVI